jgi:hypothetical protein
VAESDRDQILAVILAIRNIWEMSHRTPSQADANIISVLTGEPSSPFSVTSGSSQVALRSPVYRVRRRLRSRWSLISPSVAEAEAGAVGTPGRFSTTKILS